MTSAERLHWMISYLLEERGSTATDMPDAESALFSLWRALVNVRRPLPAAPEYLAMEDAFLQERLARIGACGIGEARDFGAGLRLWQGDMTRLAADAVVNAGNPDLLGCFQPCHGCIDNAIHTLAGVRLRLACRELMDRQGFPEEPGTAKITPAFNLPSRWVIHTVGPVVADAPSASQEAQLASCYRASLALAVRMELSSIAFCCISTGAYRFPRVRACEIALASVCRVLAETGAGIAVIFNTFTDEDTAIYERALAAL